MTNILEFIASSPNFPGANCATTGDPDAFFAEDVREMRKIAPTLLKVCMECVHRIECRDFAIAEDINHGFWGGTTPEERRKMQPKKTAKSRRSALGVRAAQLRAQGLRWPEIADELSVTASAAQKAWSRYMEDQEAAS